MDDLFFSVHNYYSFASNNSPPPSVEPGMSNESPARDLGCPFVSDRVP